MSIETKAIQFISFICLVPTRLDEIMAKCRRGWVTTLSTCLKPMGMDTSLLGTDEAIATYMSVFDEFRTLVKITGQYFYRML